MISVAENGAGRLLAVPQQWLH